MVVFRFDHQLDVVFQDAELCELRNAEVQALIEELVDEDVVVFDEICLDFCSVLVHQIVMFEVFLEQLAEFLEKRHVRHDVDVSQDGGHEDNLFFLQVEVCDAIALDNGEANRVRFVVHGSERLEDVGDVEVLAVMSLDNEVEVSVQDVDGAGHAVDVTEVAS